MKTIHVLLKCLAVSFLVLQSCKHDKTTVKPEGTDSPGPLAGKLKTILVNGEKEFWTAYSYAQDGTLEKEQSFNKTKVQNETDFDYAGGKITSTVLKRSYAEGLSPAVVRHFYYTNGMLSSIREFDVDPYSLERSAFNYVFSYSGGVLKELRTEIVRSAGDYVLYQLTKFDADARGNVVKAEIQTYRNNQAQNTEIRQYVYDDKVNPLVKLTDPLKFSVYFSPNNVVKETITPSPGGSSTVTGYQYEYNADGKPSRSSVSAESFRVFDYNK
ncbi:hypothetical protein [Pedobacter sp. JY14-1]|uniref:hypothetical protein n=1 Tax=Pedobacter sp. JY14-1 TaxID=3034151 RepID=UPI0023E2083F|nr:hypothetical protein [Pedobacter sp. JY14-1]